MLPDFTTSQGPRSLGGAATLSELVALGEVPGASVATTTGRRDGTTGDFEVWTGTATTRTQPDATGAGGALVAESSSNNDDAGGSGTELLLVSYVEAGSLWPRFGIAVMDGMNSVPVLKATQTPTGVAIIGGGTPVTDAVRVTSAFSLPSTAAGGPKGEVVNAGDIEISIGAEILDHIPAGFNSSQSVSTFIPRGKRAALTVIYASMSEDSGGGFLLLRFRRWNRVGGVVVPGSAMLSSFPIEVGSGAVAVPLSQGVPLPPMTDLIMFASNPGGGTETTAAAFGLLLTDNGDVDPKPLLRPPSLTQ